MNSKGQAAIEMLFVVVFVIGTTVVFGTALYDENADTQTIVMTKTLLMEKINLLATPYLIDRITLEKTVPTPTQLTIHVYTNPSTPNPTIPRTDLTGIQDAIKTKTSYTAVLIRFNS